MKCLIYLNIFLLFLFLTVAPAHAFDEFPTVYKNSNFNINFSTFELGTVGTFSNDNGNNAEVVLTEFSHPSSDRSLFLGTQTMSSRSLSLFDNTSIGDRATEVSGYLSIAIDPQQLSEDGTQTLHFGLSGGSAYTILNFQYNHETGECTVGGNNLTTSLVPCADFDINYYVDSEQGIFTAQMAGATTQRTATTTFADDYRVRLVNLRDGDLQENNFYIKNWQHFTDGTAWPPGAQGGSGDFPESSFTPVSSFSAHNTRFTDLQFQQTSTTTMTATVDYFIDMEEIDTTQSLYNPTLVRMGLSLRPTTTASYRSESIEGYTDGNNQVQLIRDTTELSDGVYDVIIQFSNGGCSMGLSECPFPQTYMYAELTIENSQLASFEALELYDSTSFLEDPVRYEQCGVSNLDGCLRNVFIWLFVPNFDNFYFTETVNYIKTKIPFSYFFTIQDQLSNLEQTSSLPVITVEYHELIGEITVLDTNNYTEPPWNDIFSWVRTTSIAFIYFTLILVLYRRTRNFIDSLAGSPPDTSTGSGGDYNVKF